MKKIQLSFICLFLFFGAFTQSLPKESRKDFIDAEYFYLNEDYTKAVDFYKKVEKTDTSNYNVKYKIGMCYLHTPLKIFNAIPYLEEAIKQTSPKYNEGSRRERNAPIDAFYHLGYAYMSVHEFDKAIDAYEKYRNQIDVSDLYNYDIASREINACKRAKDLVKNPREMEIENIGNAINTSAEEFNPCVPNNDTTIIFTRKFPINADNTEEALEYEYRIYQSFMYEGEENWSEPEDITPVLQTNGKAMTVSINGAGNILLLYKDNYEHGSLSELNKGTLLISNYRFGRWSKAREFTSPINERSDETHASISNDGNMLFFTSDREGGQGGLDIWISRKSQGQWSVPVNMGENINTPLDEISPFLINDTLLIFCSQSHDNMGGYDVFYSRHTQEGWSTPVNMRPPISSIADDMYYAPSNNGQVGYYAMERHEGYLTFGKKDIYKIQLFETIDGQKIDRAVVDSTLMIAAVDSVHADSIAKIAIPFSGKIKTGDNNEITNDIVIELHDPKTDAVIGKIHPDSLGNFSMRAVPGDYALLVKSQNYKESKHTIFIPKNESFDLVLNINLVSKQVESGEYIQIKAIFFAYNSYELSRESQIELERLYNVMMENPAMYVEVVGHTDSRGSAQYNKGLSIKRSQAAINYLVNKGIEKERFVSKGAGEEEHIAREKNADGSYNDEGLRLNRRVEIKILNSGAYNVEIADIEIPDNLKLKEFNRFSVLIAQTPLKFKPEDFKKLQDAGFPKIEEINGEKNFVYYFGDFKTKADAVELLNKAIDLGYNDAKITDYFELNKMFTFTVTKKTESKPKTYTIQLAASYKQMDVDRHFKGIKDLSVYFGDDGYYRYTTGKYTALSKANTEKEKLVKEGHNAFVLNESQFDGMKPIVPLKKSAYTIQLIAMKNKVDSSYFKDVYKDVTQRIGNDGYYRYTYGEYKTWEEANAALATLQKKGFTNLFVRKINWYERP